MCGATQLRLDTSRCGIVTVQLFIQDRQAALFFQHSRTPVETGRWDQAQS